VSLLPTLVGLVALASCAPSALVLPLASRHEYPAGLEERNPGLAVSWQRGCWTAEAGGFRNSFGDMAPYLAVGAWRSVYYSDEVAFSVGLLAGASLYPSDTSQEPSIVPLAGPAVEVSLWRVGARLGFIPDVGQLGGHLLTLQLTVDWPQ